MLRWNSVRLRLTVWNVVVMAVLVGLSGLALCEQERYGLSRSIDSELVARVRAAELALPPLPEFAAPGDAAGLPSGLPFPTPSPADEAGILVPPRFLTTDGRPRVRGLHAWDANTCGLSAGGQSVFSTVELAGVRLRVYSAPVTRDGSVVGVVQVAHALTDHDRLVAGQIRTLWIFLPISVLIAGALGIILTDRALQPVQRVTRAAAEIGAGDLSRRLNVTGDDELAELARTFNGMIARLEGAFQALETAYQRLQQAYKRLESAYSQQRRFVSDASHELRTPLTRLRASTSLALSSERSAEEYRQALVVADRSADLMSALVHDLLLLARADASQLGLRSDTIAVDSILRQAVEQVFDPDAAAIEVDSAATGAVFQGDETHLVRVFVNLLENALDHTPTDGTVTVSVSATSEQTVVRVADTGEGILPEHLPHVCERFYRADPSRKKARGGTGLGLALCQTLLAAHGGSLEITSVPNQGTAVTVTVPGGRPLPGLSRPLRAGEEEWLAADPLFPLGTARETTRPESFTS